MATLHIRNVPDDVVDRLKTRARRSARSLNAEVVQALSEATRRQTVDEILEEVDRIRGNITSPPTGEQIVDWIHEAREERTEQILRAALRRQND